MTGPGDQLVEAIEADELEQAEAERRAAATLEEEGAVKSWLKRIEEAPAEDLSNILVKLPVETAEKIQAAADKLKMDIDAFVAMVLGEKK